MLVRPDVVVLALSAVGIAFGLGGRFYWANQLRASHDVWYHLLAAEKIRANGHELPERIDHFIFEGPYDYPPGLHLVLSYVPEWFLDDYKWVIAPVVDATHVFGLLVPVAVLTTGRLDIALGAAAIYLLVPELFKHFTVMTPRVLGTVLFTVTFLATELAVSGRPAFFILALLSGGVLLLTHKMSTQALGITLLSFAGIRLEPLYLLVGVGIVATALVVSRGHYLKVLRSHVAIIDFWRIQHDKGNPPAAFMRDFGRESGGSADAASVVDRLKSVAKRFDPVLFVLSNAWLFVLVPLLLWARSRVLFEPLAESVALWAVILFVTAVVTQYVPVFKLIGEGHKYFMWGAFPTAFTLSLVSFRVESLWIAGVLLGTGVGSMAYVYMDMQSRVDASNRVNVYERAPELLSELSGSGHERIMCVPPGINYTLAYMTRKKLLWHDSTTAYMDGEVYYPTPLRPLEEIALEYDIDSVVVDTTQVAVSSDDFERYELTMEENGYLLLERFEAAA